MNNKIMLNAPELKQLEQSKAAQIKATFEPMVKMLESFELLYDEIIKESQKGITQELTAKAKRVRIDIAKIRIETGKLKDKQKEYIKLEDKAIMGVHNILVHAVKEKEDNLKKLENYFEELEKQRLENLQLERAEKLAPYVEDAHERDLAKFADDEFEALLQIKKRQYEDKIAAEKAAELARIEKEKAEAEERERIRKENEQLRKEAAKRAKEERERQAKAEAEKKAREEKERQEREIQEAKLKAEREKLAKIQAELKAKKEAEKKAEQERLMAIENELKKGDSEKVKDLITDLEKLKSKYVFKSKSNQKMYVQVGELLSKIIAHIS